MHCYEFINSHKNTFYDKNVFNDIKEIIILKLQLESTKDDDLLTELRKNIFIGKADVVHNVIKPFIKDAFDFVHPRFRKCLWGIFNPIVTFDQFIEDTVSEIIIRDGNTININIPRHVGCVNIDNILGNWILCYNEEKQMKHYGYSSLKIIQSEGVSLHEFS